jgi:hypothetical protein
VPANALVQACLRPPTLDESLMNCRPGLLGLMDGSTGWATLLNMRPAACMRRRMLSSNSSRVDGLALGDHGGSIVMWGSGTVSKNALSAAIPATPSAIEWCTLINMPTRPPGRPRSRVFGPSGHAVRHVTTRGLGRHIKSLAWVREIDVVELAVDDVQGLWPCSQLSLSIHPFSGALRVAHKRLSPLRPYLASFG